MRLISTWLLGIFMGAGLAACIMAPVPCPPPVTTTVLTVPGATEADSLTVKLPAVVTSAQADTLALAARTATDDGLPAGLLQGILLQESDAGANARYKVAGQDSGLHVNQRYYGIGQIKLDAARDVLQRYPSMWITFGFQTHTDEEVIAKLIENDAFNIAVASKYLLLLRQSGFKSPKALAVAYNKGPGGAVGVDVTADPYAQGVTAKMRKVAGVRPMLTGIYHVHTGDTLSGISLRSGHSIDTIFKANPSAFVDSNPDRLMADVDIVIPALR